METLLDRAVRYTPHPVTGDQDSWLRELFAGWFVGDFSPNLPPAPEAAVRRRREAIQRSATFPAFHPPVRQVVAGADGTTWLLREWGLDGPDRWEVYGPRGELIGELRIPEGRGGFLPWDPRMTLLRVTADEVWGTTLREFDVPYARRFRVLQECEGVVRCARSRGMSDVSLTAGMAWDAMEKAGPRDRAGDDRRRTPIPALLEEALQAQLLPLTRGRLVG